MSSANFVSAGQKWVPYYSNRNGRNEQLFILAIQSKYNVKTKIKKNIAVPLVRSFKVGTLNTQCNLNILLLSLYFIYNIYIINIYDDAQRFFYNIQNTNWFPSPGVLFSGCTCHSTNQLALPILHTYQKFSHKLNKKLTLKMEENYHTKVVRWIFAFQMV